MKFDGRLMDATFKLTETTAATKLLEHDIDRINARLSNLAKEPR